MARIGYFFFFFFLKSDFPTHTTPAGQYSDVIGYY